MTKIRTGFWFGLDVEIDFWRSWKKNSFLFIYAVCHAFRVNIHTTRAFITFVDTVVDVVAFPFIGNTDLTVSAFEHRRRTFEICERKKKKAWYINRTCGGAMLWRGKLPVKEAIAQKKLVKVWMIMKQWFFSSNIFQLCKIVLSIFIIVFF